MMQSGWLPCDVRLQITQLDLFIMRRLPAIGLGDSIGLCCRYLQVVVRHLAFRAITQLWGFHRHKDQIPIPTQNVRSIA